MAFILVVEDDMNNAMVFQTLLKRLGNHETEITEDVDEIFRKCRSGAVDLVIMDVSLTNSTHEGRKVNGLEITKLLKNDEACRNIPVVLATAHAMHGDKERFLKESGANGYLEKPIMDPNVFIGKVDAMLTEQTVEDAQVEKQA